MSITHHADCYREHHECAIAEVERLRDAYQGYVSPVSHMAALSAFGEELRATIDKQAAEIERLTIAEFVAEDRDAAHERADAALATIARVTALADPTMKRWPYVHVIALRKALDGEHD